MLREKFSFRKKINGAEYFSNLFFKLFISALEYILSLYLLLLFVRKIIRFARESLESFVSIIQIDSDVRLLFAFTWSNQTKEAPLSCSFSPLLVFNLNSFTDETFIVPMKIHFLDYMSWYWKLPSSKKERGKKGHGGLWFISSDRYLNGEILRAWPRARHGMEWQLKLDSSYFKRYFSPLWLRFFSSSSSSSSSLLIFSPRFPGFSLLASVEYFWFKRNSLLW